MNQKDDPRKVLQKMVEKAGSQKDVADELGISYTYLSNLIRGKADISDNIAKKLGFERKTVYAPLGDEK